MLNDKKVELTGFCFDLLKNKRKINITRYVYSLLSLHK